MPGETLSEVLSDATLVWPGNKPLVVMLHNSYPLITRSDVFEGWNASTRQITHFIDGLQRQFEVIDLEGYSAALESGRGRGQVLFTCDDGYAQMLHELGDFLNARQIRPTLFLISGLQTGEVTPWYYQLALFFRRTTLVRVDYRGGSHPISSSAERQALYRRIQSDLLSTRSVQEFQQLLKTVTDMDASIDYTRLDADMRPLSEADVERVLSQGWTIGCHGHSHVPFSLMSDQELESEVEVARSTLFERYRIRPTAISYPNGAIRPEQLHIIGRSFQLGFMAAPQPETAGSLQCGRLAFPEDRHLVLESRWHSPQLDAATRITSASRRVSDATKEIQAGAAEAHGRPRVVIMCGPLEPERAFVARLAESATVVGLFIHNDSDRELPFRQLPLDWANEAIAHLVAHEITGPDADAIWQFGWSCQYFSLRPTMTAYETADVNDPAIFPLVEALRPDVILVFGTGPIRDPRLLSLPVPKYNLHCGLSPYYRGFFTLRWPIVNDEPEKIGVTVHELNERIDGGPLVAQQVLELDGSEKARNVEYAAADAGITLMQEIVRLMGRGESVIAEDQDLSAGRLYMFNEWSPAQDEATEIRLEDGFAAQARRRSREVAVRRLEVAPATRS